MQLKRLLDTGWTFRFERGQAIQKGYVAITELPCHLVEVDTKRESWDYQGFWNNVQSLQFLVGTIVLQKILLLAKGICQILQSTDIDLAAAVNLVGTTKETLLE